MKTATPRSIRFCQTGNFILRLVLLIYFVALPLVLMLTALFDPGLRQGDIPHFAFTLHRRLTPQIQQWAQQRVLTDEAMQLNDEDVPATEWPIFGAVFYLWATEALEESWNNDPSTVSLAPSMYARDAIKAATELVLDPGHATWVRDKWGEDYLQQENCFYRMLIISAMTSYQRLSGDTCYESQLREQVDDLARDITDSPQGLIDDYPGECWPSDVLAALAAIQRADALLGTDHSDMIQQAQRGFTGPLLDETGLPPYMANSKSAYIDEARGSTSQWALAWAPYLWPVTAQQWYQAFEDQFWQRRGGMAGFREYKYDRNTSDWSFDVDAGPIIAGFGSATTAFALGAARVNSRMDHAHAITTQAIVLSWPLIDGTLLLPRLLSSSMHAPYVGEAALLFNLTRTPVNTAFIIQGRDTPPVVYGVLILVSLLLLLESRSILRASRHLYHNPADSRSYTKPQLQMSLWLTLIALGIGLGLGINLFAGLLCLGLAHQVPYGRRPMKGASHENANTENLCCGQC